MCLCVYVQGTAIKQVTREVRRTELIEDVFKIRVDMELFLQTARVHFTLSVKLAL